MKKQNRLTRKEFIRITTTGVAGATMLSAGFPAVAGRLAPRQVPLGKTGFMVTPLCFGASRAQDKAIILAALDKGMNFLDTGRQYGHGRNEVLIGKTLRDYSGKVIIQSKVKVDIPGTGRALLTRKAKGMIRDKMERSLHESLDALQRDSLDIWLCHGPEKEEILFHDEVLKFFEEAKRQGLILSHGFSAHSHQAEFVHRANKINFYDVIMVGYNHKGSMVHSLSGIYRKFDNDALEKELQTAHARGVGILAMKTCSGGPYSPDPGMAPSFPQAVKWVLDKPFIDAAAVAMTTFEQIDQHAKLLF